MHENIEESYRKFLNGYCNDPNICKCVKLLNANKIKVLSSLSQFLQNIQPLFK